MSTIGPINTGLVLRVLQGSHAEPYHHLARSVVSVGRTTPETPCTPSYITFPEPTVSRLHLVLTWEPGAKAYMVHHRSQTNPTVLNGKPLTRSELLKPGDILALGRLVMRLDLATESEALAEHPELQAERLQLCLRGAGPQGRTYLIPVESEHLTVDFTPRREAAAVAKTETGSQRTSVPAEVEAGLSFHFQREQDKATVEAHGGAPPTLRRTLLPFGALELPLQPGTPVELSHQDALHHQGYIVWLSRLENPEPPSGTVEGSPLPQVPGEAKRSLSRLPSLHIINGAWQGAVVRVADRGTYSFELGQESRSFRHHFPYPDIPPCRITVNDGAAQLRVGEIGNDQFVDLNGDLLFAGESVDLFSGTQLFLGNTELRWEIPELSREYLLFQVRYEDTVFPVLRQEMKIGTAAHCDIRIPSPALAPVVGALKFTPSGFLYQHQNIALSARVDGTEVSSGLNHPVRCGSALLLAPGVTIQLEEGT